MVGRMRSMLCGGLLCEDCVTYLTYLTQHTQLERFFQVNADKIEGAYTKHISISKLLLAAIRGQTDYLTI